MSRVSIVVPIFNGAKYLRSLQTYFSRQTYKDCEILLIVSSKSTDGSYTEANKLFGDVEGCRVILYEDVDSLGGSKNKGLDNATGDYIWFMDVDDFASDHFLEELVKIKEENSADIVACNFVYSHNDMPFDEYPGKFPVKVLTSSEALRARVDGKFPVTSWSMLYDLPFLKEHGLRFESGLAEDIVFTYTALSLSSKVCYYPKPLYKYRINYSSVCNNSATRDIRAETEVRRFETLDKLFESDRYMRRMFCLYRVRSAGHMTYRSFRRYIKGPEVKNAVHKCREPWVRFEFGVARWLSPLYFAAIRLFFRVIYYRSGKTYTPMERESYDDSRKSPTNEGGKENGPD
ncbi:MAG: glycosyltransferase [Candidatus Methanomethylophilaceae archaeon]|nr:glycosyltransferase [Candidatus Methanomethylophilaceae archaeon]